MKKIGLLLIMGLVAIMLQASDFVSKVKEVGDDSFGWCCLTGNGVDLPVEIQRDDAGSLTFKLLDSNLEVFKQFTISGLQTEDEALGIRGHNHIQNYRNCYVTRYFFNDDDKFEVVIVGSYAGNDSYSNVRIINEDGEVLTTLDFAWGGQYITIGLKNYLMANGGYNNGEDVYSIYAINNQTGKPLEKSSFDVNHDSKVNVSDVTALINHILGIR